MKKIVVIGGGTMGLDIAHTFARSGNQVIVREINDEFANKARTVWSPLWRSWSPRERWTRPRRLRSWAT